MVAKVLIDNGSALNLNIIPSSTISSINPAEIRSAPMVAKAFDGSQRGIAEAVDLEVIIGGQPFQTTFHILDQLHNAVRTSVDSYGGSGSIHPSSEGEIYCQWKVSGRERRGTNTDINN